MLITPVQPHNSLNNMVFQTQTRSEDRQSDNNSKIQQIKSFARKPPTLKTSKLPPRGINRSVSTVKKKPISEHKHQENMRKKVAQKLENIDEQKEEVTQREQILGDILREYEQISKDKNILTAEIRNMKTYLSDIRSKLDQSLTVLNRNTTLFAIRRGGIANSMFYTQSGRAKKIGSKKRKSKAGKSNKTKDSLEKNPF